MVSTTTKPDTKLINEHFLKSKFPKKHQHYKLDNFFCFQGNTGKIIDWNQSRDILVTEDFIIGLIEGLEQEIGSASSVVMYNIGAEWGRRDAKFFGQWFKEEFGYEKGIDQHILPYVLEAWWWPFTAQGWGNWDIDLSDQKNGFLFINIFDSAVARTLGDVGKPVCHIYAGLFSGFFSSLIKKELDCIEIQCYSMGETYCKFLLGKKETINAATFWQNEGATAKDIQTQLENGEYLK